MAPVSTRDFPDVLRPATTVGLSDESIADREIGKRFSCSAQGAPGRLRAILRGESAGKQVLMSFSRSPDVRRDQRPVLHRPRQRQPTEEVAQAVRQGESAVGGHPHLVARSHGRIASSTSRHSCLPPSVASRKPYVHAVKRCLIMHTVQSSSGESGLNPLHRLHPCQ